MTRERAQQLWHDRNCWQNRLPTSVLLVLVLTRRLSDGRTSARTAAASRFSPVQHSPARTGAGAGTVRARRALCSTCVSPCFVSSSTGTRHVQEGDRSPFTSGSEGAIQRLLKQFHIMSSVSEGNSLRLAQDEASLRSSSSTSGSRLTISNSAPDSAANGQTCTSKESVILALQVKETRPASCRVNNTSCSSRQPDEGHF